MSSPGASFTDRQGQYLAFIDAYTRVNGRPPAEADMQRHFRVSPPSVHQMVLTLEREGWIRKKPGLARSIEVLVDPERLPLLCKPQPSNPLGRGTSHSPHRVAAVHGARFLREAGVLMKDKGR